jgi:NAD(P)-dependent dehydrogenase (short-subunit alcohol dehydrogenase family)
MPRAETMNGKVCLVTGATSGLGRATALGLAAAGASVVIVGRDRERGEAVRAELAAAHSEAKPMLVLCDLSSQRQLMQLAATVRERLGRLDALINNAGVDVSRRELTEDGLELTFAVNHLAPFLLTNLLIGMLEASAPARLITVSSGAHYQGKLDFDDLQGERGFRGQRAYNQSKLANVLFTLELARRLAGTAVTANCVDPGWVKGTSLGRTASVGLKAMALVMWPAMVTPDQGADTIIWTATAPELAQQSGTYFKKRKPHEPSKPARDPELARRLWAESERLSGVTFDLPRPGV